MRKSWLLCVLLGTLAWGQAAPGAPPAAQAGPGAGPKPPIFGACPAPDTSASVPANAVVSLQGVARRHERRPPRAPRPNPRRGENCSRRLPLRIARQSSPRPSLKNWPSAVAPNVTPQLKKQLAGVLPRLIAMSRRRRRRVWTRLREFEETVKFAKMQMLTNELQRKIQKEAANVPQADIEKYYKEHPEAFEQFNLERLFVPRTKQARRSQGEEEKRTKS